MSLTSIHPKYGKIKIKKKYTKGDSEWNRIHLRTFYFHLNKEKDKEVIEWLATHKPYSLLIRRYIREGVERDMAKEAELTQTQDKPL